MKLPRGIEVTPYGFRTYVQFRGQSETKRWPRDTPLPVMVDHREKVKARIRLGLIQAATTAPTGFRADAVTYLATVAAMPTYQEREKHINEWVAVFDNRPRSSIRPPEIRAHLQTLRDGGLSAMSVNHRRTALMHLFNVLDADTNAPNPVRKVPRFRSDEAVPRSLDYKTIRAILKQVDASRADPASKARMAILAWTGIPPATLKRVTREDWQDKALFLPGRRKGKGTKGRTIGLVAPARKALKLLDREDGWGMFDTPSLNRLFKRCAKKAGIEGYTLYTLRHSFITQAYLSSGDIQATAELAGHAADTRQTRRYALAALSPRAATTLAQFERATRQRTRRTPKTKKNTA